MIHISLTIPLIKADLATELKVIENIDVKHNFHRETIRKSLQQKFKK